MRSRNLLVLFGLAAFALLGIKCNGNGGPSHLIVFMAEDATGQGNRNIWIVREDGTGLLELTNEPAGSGIIDEDPSFSPDGHEVAYAHNDNSQPDIFVVDTHGLNRRNLTNGQANWRYLERPRFTPDGNWIVFDAYLYQPQQKLQYTDLMAVGATPANAGTLVNLTTDWGTNESFPAISSDGSQLLCSFHEQGQLGATVGYAGLQDSSNTITLSGVTSTGTSAGDISAVSFDPAPQSWQLTYNASDEVWTATWTGSAMVGQTQLTHGMPDVGSSGAAFGHDGTWIAFGVRDMTNELAPGQLYVMNADGTNPHEVPLGPQMSVAWGELALDAY